MRFNAIQIIALAIFYLDAIFSLATAIRKKRWPGLAELETSLIPMIAVTAFLVSRPVLWFPTYSPFFATGLVLLAGGIVLRIVSQRYLGGNDDDFWQGRYDEKIRTLVTTGPYSVIRHPLYTSWIMYYLGLVLVIPHPVTFTAFILAAAALVYTTYEEEKFLAAVFPAYRTYREETGMFLPRDYNFLYKE
jgi:protein-S-isoprenylcysteine O-methyltransferase Ste14